MDIEDIKKLAPKERIEKLKELEAEEKKRLKQAEELLKESTHEAEQEEIEDIIRRIDTPDLLGDVDEQTVPGEGEPVNPNKDSEIEGRIRNYNLATEETYDRVRELYDRAYEGTLTPEDEANLQFYQQQFKEVNPDYMQGSERSVVTRTEQLFKKLMKYY